MTLPSCRYEEQGIDRCHRIGQNREVRVKRLTIKDTVEKRILELQAQKMALSKAALGEGDVTDGMSGRIRLNLDDLYHLFGLRNPGGAAGAAGAGPGNA